MRTKHLLYLLAFTIFMDYGVAISIDSQSAANMIALCSTQPASLPLSSANLNRADVNIAERQFLMCIWVGDSLCAREALQNLKKMKLNDDQGHGTDFLEVYGNEVTTLGDKIGPLTATEEGKMVLDNLKQQNYDAAFETVTSVGSLDLSRQLSLAYYLFKYPGAVYSPISSRVLVTGNPQDDLELLEAVAYASTREDAELKTLAGELKNQKEMQDTSVIINKMHIYQAAGKIRIAAIYAKKLIELGVNYPDALAIRAAALLCGETNSKGIEKHKSANDLYTVYIEQNGNSRSFIRTGISLTEISAKWDEALKTVTNDQAKNALKAPSIKTMPVLPSSFEAVMSEAERVANLEFSSAPPPPIYNSPPPPPIDSSPPPPPVDKSRRRLSINILGTPSGSPQQTAIQNKDYSSTSNLFTEGTLDAARRRLKGVTVGQSKPVYTPSTVEKLLQNAFAQTMQVYRGHENDIKKENESAFDGEWDDYSGETTSMSPNTFVPGSVVVEKSQPEYKASTSSGIETPIIGNESVRPIRTNLSQRRLARKAQKPPKASKKRSRRELQQTPTRNGAKIQTPATQRRLARKKSRIQTPTAQQNPTHEKVPTPATQTSATPLDVQLGPTSKPIQRSMVNQSPSKQSGAPNLGIFGVQLRTIPQNAHRPAQTSPTNRPPVARREMSVRDRVQFFESAS